MQVLAAWTAMRDASSAAQQLLQQLAVADPIRNMLYVRQGQEAAALLATANLAIAAITGSDGGAGEAAAAAPGAV